MSFTRSRENRKTTCYRPANIEFLLLVNTNSNFDIDFAIYALLKI